MEQPLDERLKSIEQKIDAVYQSSEKTRKYFLTLIIISILAFVLPLLGLIFAIPTFMDTYTSIEGL